MGAERAPVVLADRLRQRARDRSAHRPLPHDARAMAEAAELLEAMADLADYRVRQRPPRMVPLMDAADALALSPRTLRWRAEHGRITAEKRGDRWFVEVPDVGA